MNPPNMLHIGIDGIFFEVQDLLRHLILALFEELFALADFQHAPVVLELLLGEELLGLPKLRERIT